MHAPRYIRGLVVRKVVLAAGLMELLPLEETGFMELHAVVPGWGSE